MVLDNSRRTVLLTAVVVVGMVVTSVGFATLTSNPLVPDADLNASDAPEEYNLTRSGTVEGVRISHNGGESIDLSDTRIILGSRNKGATFDQSNNWTHRSESADLVLRVWYNGGPVSRAENFTAGDRLSVVKIRGTTPLPATGSLRVRLFHLPSQRTILDQQVVVR